MKILLSLLLATSLFSPASGLSIRLPQITGDQKSQTGETDQNTIQCFLRDDGKESAAISGDLLIDKAFLDHDFGVILSAADGKGRVVCSSAIQGREKNGTVHFHFTLARELVGTTKFWIFTKDQNQPVMELHLKTVAIHIKAEG